MPGRILAGEFGESGAYGQVWARINDLDDAEAGRALGGSHDLADFLPD